MLDTEKIIADFISAAKFARIDIAENAIEPEILERPHIPPASLPANKMAVYVFLWGDVCLKVGKIGPRSQARYTSQHYKPNSSNSNLAKSILKHGAGIGIPPLSTETVGNWIKTETDRINFLMDKRIGIPILSLMEAFLQCYLSPKFEGFESQK